MPKPTLTERMTKIETRLEDLRKDVIEPMAEGIKTIESRLNNGLCSQVELHEKLLQDPKNTIDFDAMRYPILQQSKSKNSSISLFLWGNIRPVWIVFRV